MGTDALGRDMLSRLIFGARGTLFVALASVLLAGAFGTVAGLVSGFFGGLCDSIMMRFVDTVIAFPGLLLAIMLLTVLGAGKTSMIVILSALNWVVFARVVRGAVLGAREAPYVEAAQVVGCRPGRVMVHHLVPHLVSPVLTLLILEFAHFVLAEASLSFLGLGVQPPDTSWGLEVSNGRDYIADGWWITTFAGLAIALTVLAANTFGSWARVAADPGARDGRPPRSLGRSRR